jgi:hypothetical protein
VRRVIGVLKDGEFSYEMDNGAVIRVKITIGADRRSATIDFTGTSAAAGEQLQRARAVVYARCFTFSARWWTTTSAQCRVPQAARRCASRRLDAQSRIRRRHGGRQRRDRRSASPMRFTGRWA